MPRITGTQGVVKSGATVVGSVIDFALDETADVVPDDVLGVTEKAFLVDRTGWTGTITVGYDKDDTGQITLTVGSTITGTLVPAGETAGNETFAGSMIITGRGMPVAAGEVVKRTYNVQGTGALTEGTVV